MRESAAMTHKIARSPGNVASSAPTGHRWSLMLQDASPPPTSEQTEPLFDRLAALAARVLGVPVALVSFLEPERQVFRGRKVVFGPLEDVRETPLSHSICQHVAARREPLVIEDTRRHPLVCDNPVVAEKKVIAYAGVPLLDPEGRALGAFCAIDHEPRRWAEEDLAMLQTLATQVTSELTLRDAARRLETDFARMREAEAGRAQSSRWRTHDLRTPLQAMLLSLQAVRELGELNADQAECLDLAQGSGEALAALVERMLDIGNLDHRGEEALHRTECRPAELIDSAIIQITALARGKRLTIRRAGSDAGPLRADRDKLTRVLVNLLANAVKFTPEGGEITIGAANGEPAAVLFSVLDSGIGIAAEHHDRVFAEGYRVDGAGTTSRSSGLGLAFCQRVVEAHGGRIWVESLPGEGSLFVCSVPVAP